MCRSNTIISTLQITTACQRPFSLLHVFIFMCIDGGMVCAGGIGHIHCIHCICKWDRFYYATGQSKGVGDTHTSTGWLPACSGWKLTVRSANGESERAKRIMIVHANHFVHETGSIGFEKSSFWCFDFSTLLLLRAGEMRAPEMSSSSSPLNRQKQIIYS